MTTSPREDVQSGSYLPRTPHDSARIMEGDAVSRISQWNEHAVAQWLEAAGFGRYVTPFVEKHVTGNVLLNMTYDTLRQSGVTNLGDRAKLLLLVNNLKGNTSPNHSTSSSVSGFPPTLVDEQLPAQGDITGASTPVSRNTPPQTAVSPTRPVRTESSSTLHPQHTSPISTGGNRLPIPPRTKSKEAFPRGWDARIHGWDSSVRTVALQDGGQPRDGFQDRTYISSLCQEKHMSARTTIYSDLVPTVNVSSLLPDRTDSLLDSNVSDSSLSTPSVSCAYGDGSSNYMGRLSAVHVSPPTGEAEFQDDSSLMSRAANPLRRQPAIRESRSKSPPRSDDSDTSNGKRRPNLAIRTNLNQLAPPNSKSISRRSPDGSLSVSPSTPNISHTARSPRDRELSREGSSGSVGTVSPTTAIVDSPNTHFVRSLRDLSFYEKDNTMDIAGLRERCIRVTGLDDQSHIIDVRNLVGAQAIRDRVFMKFNLRDPGERMRYGIYGLDFSGQLDTENQLDDEALLAICKSPNYQLKAHLVLKRLDEECALPLPDEKLVDTPATPHEVSEVDEPLSSPIVPKQSTRRGLLKLFSNATKRAVAPPEDEPYVDVSNIAPHSAPVRLESNNDIPLLGPPDQDGFPEGETGDFQSIDDLPYDGPLSRVTTKKLEHFFGERPPSELICENLEEFFPSLSRSRPITSQGQGEMTGGDHVPERERLSLKNFVKETMKRKRASRSETSFGRRLSRPAALVLSELSEPDKVPTQEQAQPEEVEQVESQWKDRIATIDEDSSVLTGKDADWLPISRNPDVDDLLRTEGGSDGEADPMERPMASRKRSAKIFGVRKGVLVDYAAEQPLSQAGSIPMIDRVWTTSLNDLDKSRRRSTVSHTSVLGRRSKQSLVGSRKNLSRSDTELDESEISTGDRLRRAGTKRAQMKRLARSDDYLHTSEKWAPLKLTWSDESFLNQRRAGTIGMNLGTRKSVASWDKRREHRSESEIEAEGTTESYKPLTSRRTTRRESKLASQNSLAAERPIAEEDEEHEDDVTASTDIALRDEQTTQEPKIPGDGSAANSLEGLDRSMPTLSRAFTHEPDKRSNVEWACGPLIGKGAYGKVFYGVNVKTGEIMAVKQVELAGMPRKRNAEDAKKDSRRRMLDALHREITLLKDLDHENIVRYLGYDVEGTTINVFLEYVSGGSISSSITSMGRFEEPLVRSLTCQILCGLEYLHERSIIHRDIKGGNVLLDENGVAKISDFGISKKNEYKMAYRFNSRMSMQGSVHWMAPEVIKAKGYSAKVDIWSLGCLILEMFTGYNPWRQLDELQTMWRLGRENTPPLPEWLSPQAQNLLEKCFTIDPDQRPTATDLLSHEFADVDPATIVDFRAYKEAAIEQKRLEEEEADALSDDDDWDGSDVNWLTSRNSLYISRVLTARRLSTMKRRASKGLASKDDNIGGDANVTPDSVVKQDAGESEPLPNSLTGTSFGSADVDADLNCEEEISHNSSAFQHRNDESHRMMSLNESVAILH
ncbi:STE/STE11/BCK1 protein [Spizellomyces punctatus DAOM BR117]|uniref:mitogen-activated protein kinase kinase kinase n=1 Tax=Spizellomyces punctatus (strain DAOM BR117) TaxID=645134 RepID=A0A0L0HJ99_SPIPD|nr:STE/STE11/BCK1 protein [Spizellomyces punctatus DAOM BR117]KND00975.1 STE/STE11/BCK1 protein [Spizellomyces punctatus DAOM BR117]|eukprot:XP_016609014.1 STE/STE11/BCK1 protein [Spizellomyces punctatus DAOM BR117]